MGTSFQGPRQVPQLIVFSGEYHLLQLPSQKEPKDAKGIM